MSAANDNGFKLAYTPAEAAAATGLGLTTIFALMKEGRLKRVKIGRSTLIPRSSLEALIAGSADAA
ncbi:Helix-turn-helix domain protein [compost metagenome]|jgi:excisionase family DNA binding protein